MFTKTARKRTFRKPPPSTLTIHEVPLFPISGSNGPGDPGYEGDIEVRYPDEYLDPSPTSPMSDTQAEFGGSEQDVKERESAAGTFSAGDWDVDDNFDVMPVWNGVWPVDGFYTASPSAWDEGIQAASGHQSIKSAHSSHPTTQFLPPRAAKEAEEAKDSDVTMSEHPSLAARFSNLGFAPPQAPPSPSLTQDNGSRRQSNTAATTASGHTPPNAQPLGDIFQRYRTVSNLQAAGNYTPPPSTSHKRTHSETVSPPGSPQSSSFNLHNSLGLFQTPLSAHFDSDPQIDSDMDSSRAPQSFSPSTPPRLHLHQQQPRPCASNSPSMATPSSKRARRQDLTSLPSEASYNPAPQTPPAPSSPASSLVANSQLARPLQRKRSYAISSSPAPSSPVWPAYGGPAGGMDID